MTDEPCLDEHALPRLERMVGRDVMDEVLDLYLENAPRRIESVRRGLAGGPLDDATRALHDIKSSAGMVGATAVQRLAEEMERLARAGDVAALRAHLERLELLLRQAERALTDARTRRNP